MSFKHVILSFSIHNWTEQNVGGEEEAGESPSCGRLFNPLFISGGAFGGKESRHCFLTNAVAVAAAK